jgi:AAA domain
MTAHWLTEATAAAGIAVSADLTELHVPLHHIVAPVEDRLALIRSAIEHAGAVVVPFREPSLPAPRDSGHVDRVDEPEAALDAMRDARERHADLFLGGGAGTGKTRVLCEFAREITKGQLIAPTGKAASRLRKKSRIRATHTVRQGGMYSPAGERVRVVDPTQRQRSWRGRRCAGPQQRHQGHAERPHSMPERAHLTLPAARGDRCLPGEFAAVRSLQRRAFTRGSPQRPTALSWPGCVKLIRCNGRSLEVRDVGSNRSRQAAPRSSATVGIYSKTARRGICCARCGRQGIAGSRLTDLRRLHG